MTFQPPSKSLENAWLSIYHIGCCFIFERFPPYLFLPTSTDKGGGDFYVHWVAARLLPWIKLSHMAVMVPARAQQLVYGGPAKAGDEPYILDTPFHILQLYFPFCLFFRPRVRPGDLYIDSGTGIGCACILKFAVTDWSVSYFYSILHIIWEFLTITLIRRFMRQVPFYYSGWFMSVWLFPIMLKLMRLLGINGCLLLLLGSGCAISDSCHSSCL